VIKGGVVSVVSMGRVNVWGVLGGESEISAG